MLCTRGEILCTMYSFFAAFSLYSVQGSYSRKEGQHSCCVNHPCSLLPFTPEVRPRPGHRYDAHRCVPQSSLLNIVYLWQIFQIVTSLCLSHEQHSSSCQYFSHTPLSLTQGIPPSKASSAGIVKNNPSGLTSPPSGLVHKCKCVLNTKEFDVNIWVITCPRQTTLNRLHVEQWKIYLWKWFHKASKTFSVHAACDTTHVKSVVQHLPNTL